MATEELDDATVAARVERGDRAIDFLKDLARRGQPMELRPGRVLGEGGMGLVREAEQVALGRDVAVKTLKALNGQLDGTAASDLLLEAWVTGALEHPNIVPVHHLGVDEAGLPLLVMKRVDGVEWSTLLGNPLQLGHRIGVEDPLAWNLGILVQVLNALRFAHSRGIIHRDVKPANVMIGHFGEVYLLDWGIAVGLRPDDTERVPLATDRTGTCGTPAYMAPEMLGRELGHEGPSEQSERTDVYLAGATLFEILAGRPPHVGADSAAVYTSIALSEPPMPADAPPELVEICRRAMQPNPAERYPSADAMQRALAGYLEHRGSSRIAARATARLEQLRGVIADGALEAGARHEAIYRHFAICRFAYHEALAAWRGNAEAREGIAEATIAVARYELGAGDPHAAVALLRELDEPGDGAVHLLDEAQRAVEAARVNHAALEELREAHDPQRGMRARWLLGAAIGLVFTVLPLTQVFGLDLLRPRSFARELLFSGLMCALLTAVALWPRRAALGKVNDRVFATAAFVFLAQCMLALGFSLLDFPLQAARTCLPLVWGTVCGVLAITVDLGLAPPALAYYAGFLYAAYDPPHTPHVMALTNFLLAATIFHRWRPKPA